MTRAVLTGGILILGSFRFRAAVGHGGVKSEKQEGDGVTPAGLMPLRQVLYRADRGARPRAGVPVQPLAPQDGWCDDPTHADYNKPVRLPHPGRHEALWRADSVYDVIGVLGWNDQPVVRKRGSAIFMHVVRPDWAPTEGCIALLRSELLAVLEAGMTEIFVEG